MAIAAKLDFGFDVPGVRANGVPRWFGAAACQSNMFTAGAMAFFTIDVCHKIVDSALVDCARSCVAVHTPLRDFALGDVTKLFKFTRWTFLAMPYGQTNASIRITADTVFDPFGYPNGWTV